MSNTHVIDQRQIGTRLVTEWQINSAADLTSLPTDEKYIGSEAHTPGYEQIWELSAGGWVEL